MERTYRVTGTVIKGHTMDFEILVWASNIKEAKALALEEWVSHGGKKIGHLFHLSAKRTNESMKWKTNWHKTGEMTPGGNWISYT